MVSRPEPQRRCRTRLPPSTGQALADLGPASRVWRARSPKSGGPRRMRGGCGRWAPRGQGRGGGSVGGQGEPRRRRGSGPGSSPRPASRGTRPRPATSSGSTRRPTGWRRPPRASAHRWEVVERARLDDPARTALTRIPRGRARRRGSGRATRARPSTSRRGCSSRARAGAEARDRDDRRPAGIDGAAARVEREQGARVRRERPVPVLVLGLERRADHAGRGVVDERVERAERGDLLRRAPRRRCRGRAPARRRAPRAPPRSPGGASARRYPIATRVAPTRRAGARSPCRSRGNRRSRGPRSAQRHARGRQRIVRRCRARDRSHPARARGSLAPSSAFDEA